MLKILTVDDSVTARKVMAKAIIKVAPDYEVLQAANGMEAIQMAVSAGADLVMAIVDYNMDGMNGEKVLEELKKTHPRTHMLICSANNQHAVRERVLKIGAGFMEKPVTEEKLRNVFKQVGITVAEVDGTAAPVVPKEKIAK